MEHEINIVNWPKKHLPVLQHVKIYGASCYIFLNVYLQTELLRTLRFCMASAVYYLLLLLFVLLDYGNLIGKQCLRNE